MSEDRPTNQSTKAEALPRRDQAGGVLAVNQDGQSSFSGLSLDLADINNYCLTTDLGM